MQLGTLESLLTGIDHDAVAGRDIEPVAMADGGERGRTTRATSRSGDGRRERSSHDKRCSRRDRRGRCRYHRPERRARPDSLALLGTGTGVAANIGTTGPMVALKVTDPRKWSAGSWLSDLVPHLAYGMATAAVWERLRR